ncbi:uncharacterized protein [Argopecten irradians]|uniref:uncharacterized protein n=1 Tax=Argopecten irradians TaxID=31199 RepID=UPI0037247C71
MASSHIIWFLLSLAQIPGTIGTPCYHYDSYYSYTVYVGFCDDGCCERTCCSLLDDDELLGILLGSVLGGIFFFTLVFIFFAVCCGCCNAKKVHPRTVGNRPPYRTGPARGHHHAPTHHVHHIHYTHEVIQRPTNATNPPSIQMNPLPADQPEPMPPPPAYGYIPPPNGPLPPVPPSFGVVTPATPPVSHPPENQNQIADDVKADYPSND